MLCKAASQFVVQRDINEKPATTILAGYPWFLDWGRDTFISLQGLMLCTKRIKEAYRILKTFAGAVDEGMIPNRFDDYNGPAHYNSIDASLWFVHAAFEYLAICDNKQDFTIKILPAVRWIIDSYLKGTKFGIRADSDGLVTGGDIDTQLTWMDAKCDGTAFTPRYGKAVEINALWYSGLERCAEFYRIKDAETCQYYHKLAEKCAENFRKIFWNEEAGYLNDCILPDGTVDDSLRPNQIYAVSLPFSPLDYLQQKQVVNIIMEKLLTPYGLRTLAPDDKRYHKRYEGNQYERDSAYHNGTVWPYLIGPFIGAYLKVNNFSNTAKADAGSFLQPLLTHLTSIGSLPEVFDGSQPHRPGGCFAQAWSIAEVLRAWQMVSGS
jgi:predicted glycogen debranching enzyme